MIGQFLTTVLEPANTIMILVALATFGLHYWSGFDSAGAYAFIPDLGLDGVVIYKVIDSSKLERHGFAATPPGGGPRHMKFSVDGKRAFVLNELALSVTTFDYDGVAGTLTAKSTAPALTEEQKSKETFTQET